MSFYPIIRNVIIANALFILVVGAIVLTLAASAGNPIYISYHGKRLSFYNSRDFGPAIVAVTYAANQPARRFEYWGSFGVDIAVHVWPDDIVFNVSVHVFILAASALLVSAIPIVLAFMKGQQRPPEPGK